MEKIKVSEGDVVIRSDGLKGRVMIHPDTHREYVKFENGQTDCLDFSCTKDYYLIGHTILGNKCTEEELEQRIAEKDEEIQQKKKEKDQLRKQLWRLREEMVEDWRERKALRELRRMNREKSTNKD